MLGVLVWEVCVHGGCVGVGGVFMVGVLVWWVLHVGCVTLAMAVHP